MLLPCSLKQHSVPFITPADGLGGERLQVLVLLASVFHANPHSASSFFTSMPALRCRFNKPISAIFPHQFSPFPFAAHVTVASHRHSDHPSIFFPTHTHPTHPRIVHPSLSPVCLPYSSPGPFPPPLSPSPANYTHNNWPCAAHPPPPLRRRHQLARSYTDRSGARCNFLFFGDSRTSNHGAVR